MGAILTLGLSTIKDDSAEKLLLSNIQHFSRAKEILNSLGGVGLGTPSVNYVQYSFSCNLGAINIIIDYCSCIKLLIQTDWYCYMTIQEPMTHRVTGLGCMCIVCT